MFATSSPEIVCCGCDPICDLGGDAHRSFLFMGTLNSLFIPLFTPSEETHQYSRVPTRTGKPGKMGRHFPVREKSGNFEQTGKVRENHTKYWKTKGI